jgi:hypothetical protein
MKSSSFDEHDKSYILILSRSDIFLITAFLIFWVMYLEVSLQLLLKKSYQYNYKTSLVDNDIESFQ